MAPTLTFTKAVRRRVKIKALLMGPTNAGKTYGALALATAMFPGKVALIDSEHDRSEFYADDFAFDRLSLPDPLPATYAAAIEAAEAEGYDCVIVDSLTQGWESIRRRKDAEEAARPSINTWTNWAKYGKEWESLMRVILESNLHVIATSRSKMAYEQVEGANGKKKIEKLGMAPIVRDNTEYEFAVTLEILASHQASVLKDNTRVFAEGELHDLTDTRIATRLRAWLERGAEPAPRPARVAEEDGEGEGRAADPAEKWNRPAPLVLTEALNLIVPGNPGALGGFAGNALSAIPADGLRRLAAYFGDEKRAATYARELEGLRLVLPWAETEATKAAARAAQPEPSPAPSPAPAPAPPPAPAPAPPPAPVPAAVGAAPDDLFSRDAIEAVLNDDDDGLPS